MAGSKFLENLIVGSSEKIQDVRKHIELAAPFPVSVMAVGPTGSGKELIAKGIHKLSGRSGKFIAVNSAAIPAELLEAELFGYEKGAFTGADKGRKGKVEDAGGGTLFLDEIGDMPLSLQAKLLRVIETKTVQKIGSEKSIPVDFRLVCATHTDISEMARRGEFRADLLYRIAVYTIANPPLAERVEDIEELITVLSMRLKKTEKKILPVSFEPDAIAFLQQYDWPGNIRELANFLQKCSVLYSGERLGIQKIEPLMPNFHDGVSTLKDQATFWDGAPQNQTPSTPFLVTKQTLLEQSRFFAADQPLNLHEFLADVEENLIVAALNETEGNVEKAAGKLGIETDMLMQKIKQFSLAEKELLAPQDRLL